MAEVESSNTQIIEKSDRIHAINVVDSSHAFYIHPSDYPGMNLVSSALLLFSYCFRGGRDPRAGPRR